MITFAIIEVEDGLTVIEFEAGANAEEAAIDHGGVLVDAGPYDSYDDAYDALLEMEEEEEHE
jgi:hypothetical protein